MTNSRESINWAKPLNLRKNVDIPAANVRGNSLNLRIESFSSRIRNSFCSWEAARDNFFVNRVVKTWSSLPNAIVISPSLIPLSWLSMGSLKKLTAIASKEAQCY